MLKVYMLHVWLAAKHMLRASFPAMSATAAMADISSLSQTLPLSVRLGQDARRCTAELAVMARNMSAKAWLLGRSHCGAQFRPAVDAKTTYEREALNA